MKIIEIRRHSMRDVQSDHLNQRGVNLARVVGQDISPFSFVTTSTLPRAFETAIAMGFAVDEENELMSSFGEAVMKEAPWPLSFVQYAAIVKRKGPSAKYADKLVKLYSKVMNTIAEQRAALVVNHGGVVELGVVACLPDADFSSWGEAVSYCEGARLYWDDGFVRGEVVRVPK